MNGLRTFTMNLAAPSKSCRYTVTSSKDKSKGNVVRNKRKNKQSGKAIIAAIAAVLFVVLLVFAWNNGTLFPPDNTAGSSAGNSTDNSAGSSSEGSTNTAPEGSTNSSANTPSQTSEGFAEATVIRVVDGDTIVVNLKGQEEKVRLIGIDCPESVHADESRNTAAGKRASEFTNSILPSGTVVYLQKDESNRDQHGRLLRYVWLELPGNASDSAEVEAKMLNAIILSAGHAQAKRYPPDTAYNNLFDRL